MKHLLKLAGLALATACSFGHAQSVATTMTSAGYVYPLNSSSFGKSCMATAGGPSNGGTWMEPDNTAKDSTGAKGCYTPTFYHIGYDMFNNSTIQNSPAYAMTTGTVINVDTNPASWSVLSGAKPVNGQAQYYTRNGSIMVLSRTTAGVPFITIYGHILISSIQAQVGDVITGGTLIGLIGYWNPPHVHIGIWPNRSTVPDSPWGREPMTDFPKYITNGTTDPLAWITNSANTPACQNGGTVEYAPLGALSTHPNGTLFTVKSDPKNAAGTVYVLYQGHPIPIPSIALLNTLYGTGKGFALRDAIQISASEFSRYYPVGSVLKAPLSSAGAQPDGRLIQQSNGPEISIVTNNGHRRPFASAQAFLNLGYQFCNVATVSNYANYPVDSLGAITQ